MRRSLTGLVPAIFTDDASGEQIPNPDPEVCSSPDPNNRLTLTLPKPLTLLAFLGGALHQNPER